MFAVTPTGLHQHKTLSTLDFIFVQSSSLSVFDRQVICLSVEKLERGEDFSQLAFYSLEQWDDVIKRGQGQDDIV